MTYTQAKQKIAAARQMTAANQGRHRIHLERGYVYANTDHVFHWCKSGIINGYVFQTDLIPSFEKQFWAIDSKSRLVMI